MENIDFRSTWIISRTLIRLIWSIYGRECGAYKPDKKSIVLDVNASCKKKIEQKIALKKNIFMHLWL